MNAFRNFYLYQATKKACVVACVLLYVSYRILEKKCLLKTFSNKNRKINVRHSSCYRLSFPKKKA